MNKVILLPVAAALLSGCSAITTKGSLSAPLTEKPDTVCIIRNPAVAVGKSAEIIQQSLKSRGIDAVIYQSITDCKSQWHMTYVLTRRWDLVPYLATGHMVLYKNNNVFSSVDFSGVNGFNFAKFGHAKEKIDGMVGALLAEKTNE